MARGKKIPVEIPSDPTAFLLSNGVAEFVLMHTVEIVSVDDASKSRGVWTAASDSVAWPHKHAFFFSLFRNTCACLDTLTCMVST